MDLTAKTYGSDINENNLITQLKILGTNFESDHEKMQYL